MTVEPAIFTCSICGEPSTEICAYCTKDTCGNHRCDRCKRCSDCCECDIPLSAAEPVRELPAAIAPLPEIELAGIGEPPETVEPTVEPADIEDSAFAAEEFERVEHGIETEAYFEPEAAPEPDPLGDTPIR